jgi:hypothetical protein
MEQTLCGWFVLLIRDHSVIFSAKDVVDDCVRVR